MSKSNATCYLLHYWWKHCLAIIIEDTHFGVHRPVTTVLNFALNCGIYHCCDATIAHSYGYSSSDLTKPRDKARLDSDFKTACCIIVIILWLAVMYLGNHHDCSIMNCNTLRLLHCSASFEQ